MATNYKLGRDCTITVGSNVIGLVKDATVNATSEEIDITTRGDGAYKRTAVGQRDLSLSLTCRYSPDDAALTALHSAYESGGTVTLTISDPTLAYAGVWCVTKFTLSQPLNGEVTVDIECKPSLQASTA